MADSYGCVYYSMSPNENPLGLISGDERVVRGGDSGSAIGKLEVLIKIMHMNLLL